MRGGWLVAPKGDGPQSILDGRRMKEDEADLLADWLRVPSCSQFCDMILRLACVFLVFTNCAMEFIGEAKLPGLPRTS